MWGVRWCNWCRGEAVYIYVPVLSLSLVSEPGIASLVLLLFLVSK